MSARPGPVKLPDGVAVRAKEARDRSGALTKSIKDRNTASKQAEEMRDLLRGCATGDEAKRLADEKQRELDDLIRSKSKNVALQAKLKQQAQALNALSADFGSRDKEILALEKQIADDALEVDKLTLERQAQTAIIDAAAGLQSFTVDRRSMAVRDVENDLHRLRTALRTFADLPVSPMQPCTQALTRYLTEMEKAIDEEAHRSQCHRCKTMNGIPRTEAAKDHVFARIAKLRDLASRPTVLGLSEAEKADRLLAQSIDAMANTKDETGATAGKMFGALVCHTNDSPPVEVVLYAYSGVVWDQQRSAAGLEKEVAKYEKQLLSTPDGSTRLALADARQKLQRAREADEAVNQALADHSDWAPARSAMGDEFRSQGGHSLPWSALDAINGGNNIVGACSAPKLIQQAHARGLKPVAMAEAWMGGGTNRDGALVVSCDTCMSNIGFQLCRICT